MNAMAKKIIDRARDFNGSFSDYVTSLKLSVTANCKLVNVEAVRELFDKLCECHEAEKALDSEYLGMKEALEDVEEYGEINEAWKMREFSKLPNVLADFVEDRKAYEFARLNFKAQRRICDFIARELDGQPLEVAEVAAPAAKADELDGVDIAAIMAHFENVTERPAVEKKEDRAEFGKAYQGAECCKLFEVGDIVEISGSYSKSENGYYFVAFVGGYINLRNLTKDCQKKTKKYTHWPLSSYHNSAEYRAEYHKLAKTATITRLDKKSAAVKDFLTDFISKKFVDDEGKAHQKKAAEILARDYADFVDTVIRIPARDGLDWIKFDKNGIWTPSEDRKNWEFHGCHFSPTVKGWAVENITIYENSGYSGNGIPRGYGLGVKIYPDHPLFLFVAAAAAKAGTLKEMKTDNLPKGNPTEKDLEALEKWLEEKRAAAEAEKQRKEAEEQEARYMAHIEVETTTAATIANARAIYSEECSAYKVTITASERPGLCSNGEPLTVSLPAAQMIFAELDDWQHANRGKGKFYGWYDKTWWKMTGPDIPGGGMSDRFDIGDYGDGRGLMGDIALKCNHSDNLRAFVLRLCAELQRAADRASDRI